MKSMLSIKNTQRSTKKTIPTRSQVIVRSGYLFIAVNFLLGLINIIVGILSGSLAITSDAIHSFIDSISGLIIIVSEKLARHHRLSIHRKKIERLATIIIALIIVITGVHIIIESIEALQEAETPNYSTPTIVVLVISISLKYLLAWWLKSAGKKEKSTVLTASGAETMNDLWISVAVLASAIIYMVWQINLESYISILISIVIIKVGLEFIFPNISRHHHHHLETSHDHQLRHPHLEE